MERIDILDGKINWRRLKVTRRTRKSNRRERERERERECECERERKKECVGIRDSIFESSV